MENRSVRVGYLLAFLATIVWSGNFIVARGLNETYSPLFISFFRWLIASVVIFPIALPFLRCDMSMLKKQWKLMLILAFLGVSLFNTLIYLAAQSTSALNLSLFAITAPLYVVVLNRIIFKESLKPIQIIGFVILISGLLILLSKGDPMMLLQLKFNKGDLLMAVGAGVFATYSVLVKKKNPSIGNLSFVSATFILGELILLPFFIGEQIFLSASIDFTQVSLIQLLYIGIGPSIISFYLWNRSIVAIGSTKAATIYNTLPLFSALFGFLMLHEPIVPAQMLSALIIVSGVLLVIQSGSSK